MRGMRRRRPAPVFGAVRVPAAVVSVMSDLSEGTYRARCRRWGTPAPRAALPGDLLDAGRVLVAERGQHLVRGRGAVQQLLQRSVDLVVERRRRPVRVETQP